METKLIDCFLAQATPTVGGRKSSQTRFNFVKVRLFTSGKADAQGSPLRTNGFDLASEQAHGEDLDFTDTVDVGHHALKSVSESLTVVHFDVNLNKFQSKRQRFGLDRLNVVIVVSQSSDLLGDGVGIDILEFRVRIHLVRHNHHTHSNHLRDQRTRIRDWGTCRGRLDCELVDFDRSV